MKDFFVSLWSFCLACAAITGLYFGHYRGVEWAYNISLFYYWLLLPLLAVLGLIMLVAGKDFKLDPHKKKPSVFGWLRGRIMGLAAIGMLAATGHFVLGTFAVMAFITVVVVDNKRRKLYEEAKAREVLDAEYTVA